MNKKPTEPDEMMRHALGVPAPVAKSTVKLISEKTSKRKPLAPEGKVVSHKLTIDHNQITLTVTLNGIENQRVAAEI